LGDRKQGGLVGPKQQRAGQRDHEAALGLLDRGELAQRRERSRTSTVRSVCASASFLLGTRRTTGNMYTFREDGTYDMGGTPGTWQVGGYLISMRPNGQPGWISTIGSTGKPFVNSSVYTRQWGCEQNLTGGACFPDRISRAWNLRILLKRG
jgi:hypothetical protein